ncbi:MAG: hypothetical protein Unbinned7865contig1001_49 [Prokaryotic dsDNA virus sp.]|nr:MAG: hypothetical protein Unbinned7865contig1001_49 [Prokaryotic dsDNA virus sp.]|tara:strand:- start:958 stop:1344 length:387 start_codon:yes stop_codon:yes gene_type:complete
MLQALLGFLGGPIAKQLSKAYQARLEAQTTEAVIEADKTIASLQAAQEIAAIQAKDRWSATSLGRWLIVVPWGIWWAGIYAVSIVNPLLGLSLTIHDVPSHINEMAMILVPAITIADAGALSLRRFRK